MLRQHTTSSNGKVYVAPGGGQAVGGLNFEVRRAADQLMHRIHALEDAHKSQGEEVAAKIQRKMGAKLDELHLQLHEIGEDGEITVLETQTRIGVKSSITLVCVRCETIVNAADANHELEAAR